jgi:uncharacterized protein YbaR (Trm112 family)
LIYKNPYYKKVRGSHLIIVSCGHCKTDLALYQKAGRGRLLRMYVERIIKSAVDLAPRPGALFCPQCNRQLATRVTLKRKKKEAYIMIRGVFNAREL